MNYTPELLYQVKSVHGENSWYDADKKLVIFTDVLGGKIYTYDEITGEKKEYTTSFAPGAVAACKDGGYIGCDKNKIYKLDDEFNIVKVLRECAADFLTEKDMFNDCKCGPDGSYYLGTQSGVGTPDGGQFWRYDPDGTFELVLNHVMISNGFAWAKDMKTFFYTDTNSHKIFAYEWEAGKLSGQRVVYADESCNFDGFCIDDEDNLWVALWQGGKVLHIDTKEGKVIDTIETGCPLTTSTVFGGPDMKTLYITTSRAMFKPGEHEDDEISGSLFKCELPVSGPALFKGAF